MGIPVLANLVHLTSWVLPVLASLYRFSRASTSTLEKEEARILNVEEKERTYGLISR